MNIKDNIYLNDRHLKVYRNIMNRQEFGLKYSLYALEKFIVFS